MNLTHRELAHVLIGLRLLTDNPDVIEGHDCLDGAEPMDAGEIDDLCEKLNVDEGPIIYDSYNEEKDGPPGFADRYTVIPWPNHPDRAMRLCYLGCSKGGLAFSQWGELSDAHGPYLGKRVALEELDEDTRKHILSRIKETA